MLNEIIGWTSKATEPAWFMELTGEIVAFALLVSFVGFAKVEKLLPKIKRPHLQTRQSFSVNASLFVVNSLLLSLCPLTALYRVAEEYSGYGLLNDMSNTAAKAILIFLAYDLLLYGWHRACHSVEMFWLFHRVHHNDPCLNVSTAFRLHFVEALLTNSLKALLIILLGIDKYSVLLLEGCTVLCIMFHHTNASFSFERSLASVMIVPFLHRVHHSTVRGEHDSNYGAVLSLWDRLFATLLEVEPQHIGILGNSPKDLIGLVKFGFGLERPVPVPAPNNLDMMIAEAAYYKAERRNFRPGNELRDWFEAKTEILGQAYGTKRRMAPNRWFGSLLQP